MFRAALLSAAALAALAIPSAAEATRPSCQQVIREVNREVTARRGRQASPLAVARTLGTEEEWVLRCMEAYGRVPGRKIKRDADEREAFERALEEGRPIERTEDTAHLSYEKEQRLRQERKERRQRQREEQEKKEFDYSSDPFFREFEF